jgi:hypothetical protein
MRALKLMVLVSAAAVAASAHAASYSALGDFTLSNPSGPWSYGTGIGGSQVAFSNNFTSCFNAANFECQNSAGSGDVPGVGKVTSGASAELVGTVLVPNSVLWMHPGDGANAPADVSVVFTAPSAGVYSVSGYFERLSTANNGNGVTVAIYDNGSSIYSDSLTTLTYGSETKFDENVTLAAGDKLTFDVGNNGEYTYDSTGLSATITAVPEPAAWALMLGGVLMAGAALRRRREALGAHTA